MIYLRIEEDPDFLSNDPTGCSPYENRTERTLKELSKKFPSNRYTLTVSSTPENEAAGVFECTIEDTWYIPC
jgi:hypothetical protein